MGRGEVRCSNENINLFKIISIFYKCIQTIKLRQTTENNGGPCMSKSDAKRVPWALKSEAKGSWPSVNMWRVGSENVWRGTQDLNQVELITMNFFFGSVAPMLLPMCFLRTHRSHGWGSTWSCLVIKNECNPGAQHPKTYDRFCLCMSMAQAHAMAFICPPDDWR